jgi:hypothetical protein
LEDSPSAAAARLEALLTEAQKLLPKVLSPAQRLAELETALKEAQALNAMWPTLCLADSEEAVGQQLAEAGFAVLPEATRILVLDQALAPYAVRARGAGSIPFQLDLVDTALCDAAMSAREMRIREQSAIAVPLSEGATAPVWGVMVLLGENLKPREVLMRIAAAGAVLLNRLED